MIATLLPMHARATPPLPVQKGSLAAEHPLCVFQVPWSNPVRGSRMLRSPRALRVVLFCACFLAISKLLLLLLPLLTF